MTHFSEHILVVKYQDYHPKEMKSICQRDICTPVLLQHYPQWSQEMDSTQMLMHGRIEKQSVVYMLNGIQVRLSKKEILSFVTTWINLKDIMLSEISHTQKDKYRMTSVLCRI
jgi:hypothetical protein